MPVLFRSLPFQVCAAIALLFLIILGFLPLFAGPSYEVSLATGLILPSLVAIATALGTLTQSRELPPSIAFVRSMECAFVFIGMAFLVMMLHGLRAGFCDPATEMALFALGPGVGTLMGAAWGFVLAQLLPVFQSWFGRRILLVALALAGPFTGALISLGRFFTSPMVFAYDPFFGFFSGTLYDTEVTDSLHTLLTYRAGSLATLAALGGAAFALIRNEKGKLRLNPKRHPGVIWAAASALVISTIVTIEGDRLGHWQTATTIARHLGASLASEECELVYPRGLDNATAHLLLRDCTAQARQVAKFFELESPPQVRAYVFSNPEQKRALTGAGRTSIAKPWRKEVYVQLDTYPHPVLGHELAHVLAGTFAKGPFKVAGAYGGWWPDPGLIEGIAVAASPDDDILTPQQWSAAMMKLDVLPPLNSVFALGFLGKNSSMAYTVAGAFVQWVVDRHGMDVLRRWYGGEPLHVVTGEALDDLEVIWRKQLENIEISDSALVHARARFDRPGVFQRRCPHAVDSFNQQGQVLVGQGDCATATLFFERATRLDPLHSRTRFNIAHCAAKVVGAEQAERQWREIAHDDTLPEAARFRAREALADLLLATGDNTQAEKNYLELLEILLNEDQLRTIDVKLRGTRNPYEGRVVRALLIGEPERATDQRLAHSLLGRWMMDAPGDGLPAYLIGRAAMASGSWSTAAEYLDWALERELNEPRIVREALRLRLIAACAQADQAAARGFLHRWKVQPGLQRVRWEVLERRLGDCLGPPSSSNSDR